MYVLVFIVPHVDIELEDNKQFISNIPRTLLKKKQFLWLYDSFPEHRSPSVKGSAWKEK